MSAIFIGMNMVVGWPVDWKIADRSWPERTLGSIFRARITREHVPWNKIQMGFEYQEEGIHDEYLSGGRVVRRDTGGTHLWQEQEIWWSSEELVTKSGQQIWRRSQPVKLSPGYHGVFRKLP